jgi:hypothetical protein
VTIYEMKKFLGLMFLTGVIRKPMNGTGQRGILLTPVFSQTMSRNRFQIIHRYLHFNNSTAIGTNEDRLYKIRPILDTLVNNFNSNYIPERERIDLMKACLVGTVVCVFAYTALVK